MTNKGIILVQKMTNIYSIQPNFSMSQRFKMLFATNTTQICGLGVISIFLYDNLSMSRIAMQFLLSLEKFFRISGQDVQDFGPDFWKNSQNNRVLWPSRQ